ncbi:hypothetical protein ACOMHN_049236 [Nucella lapillus]
MAATLLADVWNTSVTSGSLGGTEEPPYDSFLLARVTQHLWYIVGPVILLLGNFGNVMTIVIMWRMKSAESAISIYFTALAVVDLITLQVHLLNMWFLYTFDLWLFDAHDVLCRILFWISAHIATTSAWFLVCMTVHRAISVVWPHRVNVMCTRRRVVLLLTVIAVLIGGVYSHYLYGSSLTYQQYLDQYHCQMEQGSYGQFVDDIFLYIDLVISSLLPFVCLVLANSVLVWTLRTSVREADQQFAAGRGEVSEARQKAARSVTTTVVCVSMTFIVLTAPGNIYQSFSYVVSTGDKLTIYQVVEHYFTMAICYMLIYLNHAVNFYLYCLTGKRFREEFINIVRCGRARGSTGFLSESARKI